MPSGSLVLAFDLDETLWPFVTAQYCLSDLDRLRHRVHKRSIALVKLLIQAGLQVAVCSRSSQPVLCEELLKCHGIRRQHVVHMHIERTSTYHKNQHLAALRNFDHVIMFDDDPRVLQSHAHEATWFSGVLVDKSTGLLPSQVFDALGEYFTVRLPNGQISNAILEFPELES